MSKITEINQIPVLNPVETNNSSLKKKDLELARKARIVIDRSLNETSEFLHLSRGEKRSAVVYVLTRNYENTTEHRGFVKLIVRLSLNIFTTLKYIFGQIYARDKAIINTYYVDSLNDFVNEKVEQTQNIDTAHFDKIRNTLKDRKPLELVKQYQDYIEIIPGLSFRDYTLFEENYGVDFSTALLTSGNTILINNFFSENIHTLTIAEVSKMKDYYVEKHEKETLLAQELEIERQEDATNRGYFFSGGEAIKAFFGYQTQSDISKAVFAPENLVLVQKPENLLSEKDVLALLKNQRKVDNSALKLTEKLTSAFTNAVKAMIQKEKINQASIDDLIALLKEGSLVEKIYADYSILNFPIRACLYIGGKIAVGQVEKYLRSVSATDVNDSEGRYHTREDFEKTFLSKGFKDEFISQATQLIDKEFLFDIVDDMADLLESSATDSLSETGSSEISFDLTNLCTVKGILTECAKDIYNSAYKIGMTKAKKLGTDQVKSKIESIYCK